LTGARSYVAIAEWAHDLLISARLRLGIGRRTPSESTIRRILQSVDLGTLDVALSSWLASRRPDPPPGGCGWSRWTARPPAAPVPTREPTAFVPLLDRIDLTNVLITADALHTQRGHAEYLHVRGGHYLLIAKANQPTLHDQLVGLPWRQIPVVDQRHDRGHGDLYRAALHPTTTGTRVASPRQWQRPTTWRYGRSPQR
jgi:hypothetical protein